MTRSLLPSGLSLCARWRLARSAYQTARAADLAAGKPLSDDTRQKGRAMVRLWSRLDVADREQLLAESARPT